MKKFFNQSFLTKTIQNEVIRYLFFGVLTTVFYMTVRIFIFTVYPSGIVSTSLANILAVIFAFVTNDFFVFDQERKGWFSRFVKFSFARLFTFFLDLFLAYIFVDTFPEIIGRFVHNNLDWVNTIETFISQILIMVTNYLFSKLFIFKNKKA
ncbi:GtrA family protein [Streptococcus chenjunshii]|uniref:GtrA family protein n=1 Tax=Streptococcus chenjunshii TaxID=2173853 RepID=A0A372KJY1_9STRE|nr:GtrA family protein [Streptococcus chenjunshii]AXQ78881.1 GtrA family protein [Streptococcus chenjunshii]RFU50381.1 GtrA family protein [Streptococcus chenjunshii]RFU52585.1 GtrA family protein [Streptococcus chenjunshii]